MKIILAIGLGSFIGGVLRYLVSLFFQQKFPGAFPYGTLAVNIVGCFLIGVVYALAFNESISADNRLFIATGILGGFTTFSAFSFETFSLIKNGQAVTAMLYIIGSVLLGLLATYAGYILFKTGQG